MARSHPRRDTPIPEPTTLHEITRRYVACAGQLAKAMGVPLTEQFIRDHHEAVSTCFIESSKVGVRLPARVKLPRLGGADRAGDGHQHHQHDDHQADQGHEAVPPLPAGEDEAAGRDHRSPVTPEGDPPLPTHVPAELPAAGQPIATLKPNVLAMLIAKAAQLSHADAQHWPLLAALQAERQRRLAQGQRRPDVRVNGASHAP
jgi:hypothetical protein